MIKSTLNESTKLITQFLITKHTQKNVANFFRLFLQIAFFLDKEYFKRTFLKASIIGLSGEISNRLTRSLFPCLT